MVALSIDELQQKAREIVQDQQPRRKVQVLSIQLWLRESSQQSCQQQTDVWKDWQTGREDICGHRLRQSIHHRAWAPVKAWEPWAHTTLLGGAVSSWRTWWWLKELRARATLQQSMGWRRNSLAMGEGILFSLLQRRTPTSACRWRRWAPETRHTSTRGRGWCSSESGETPSLEMLQESSTEVLDLQAQERFQSTQQETAAGMAISHLVVAADSHTPATNRQSEWVRKFFH